mmetsp:Transcript_151877/g.485442  ORF Transcript_151877/g.485442 Transcript_151877/m.485442 type:complete len:133 (-) Transcript_151877:207-605(-)
MGSHCCSEDFDSYDDVCSDLVSVVIAQPFMHDVGTFAASSWASRLEPLLAAKTSVGLPLSAIVAGFCFVLAAETSTLDMSIQYTLRPGTRGPITKVDGDGVFFADVPSAVHLTRSGALCFAKEGAKFMQLLY